MTDETFETTLRAWLADRAPVAASPSLRARIAAVPTADVPSRLTPIGGPAGWLASIGIAAMVVVGLTWLATSGLVLRSGNGSGDGPDAVPALPPLDPTVVGVGVVEAGFEPLPIVTVGVLVIGLAVVIVRTRLRWVRALAVGAVVLLLALVLTISNTSWIGFGPNGAWAAGLGFDHWGTIGQTDDASQNAVFHVRPGEPFTFAFTLTNHAPVPLTVEGLVPEPPLVGFQLTGLGLQRSVDGVEPDQWPVSALPADSVPFTPVQLQPGADRLIVVTGMAGPCAGGWEAAGNATSMSTDRITLAYSVLGAERTEQVTLPLTVEIPIVMGCSG